MLEMLAASVVAGALVALVGQLLVATAMQQQAANDRMLASAELANAAERIAAMKYGEVTVEDLKTIALSAGVAESLHQAALTFKVHEEAGPPAGKRIDIVLSWTGSAEGPARTLRLTTWKFSIGEDA